MPRGWHVGVAFALHKMLRGTVPPASDQTAALEVLPYRNSLAEPSARWFLSCEPGIIITLTFPPGRGVGID